MYRDRVSERRRMVEDQITARGVEDVAILEAMAAVPREIFIQPELQERAYEDAALPIGAGETVWQPHLVAAVLAGLEVRTEHRILEIGTGSGYAAAVMSRCVRDVYTVERHAELAAGATRRARALGYANIHVLHGEGNLGWPEHAPYDGVVVTTGGAEVSPALLEQLVVGGRLVILVDGPRDEHSLVRVTRGGENHYVREHLGGAGRARPRGTPG